MINQPFLIDTNIIIDFLRGRSEALSFFNSIPKNTELFISSITVTELFAGVKNKEEQRILDSLLKKYSVISIDHLLAKEGGLIKNQYGASHGVGIADAVIAATALQQKAKLFTLNVKHFPMIESKVKPY